MVFPLTYLVCVQRHAALRKNQDFSILLPLEKLAPASTLPTTSIKFQRLSLALMCFPSLIPRANMIVKVTVNPSGYITTLQTCYTAMSHCPAKIYLNFILPIFIRGYGEASPPFPTNWNQVDQQIPDDYQPHPSDVFHPQVITEVAHDPFQ